MEMQTADPGTTVREIGFPLYQGKGWLKFLGVLSILQGILIALSIVGIIVAWLPIWIGILLYQTATTLEVAHQTGDRAMLGQALGKLKLYFTIQGIMTLIGLIVGAMAMSLGMLGAVIDAVQ